MAKIKNYADGWYLCLHPLTKHYFSLIFDGRYQPKPAPFK